MTGRIDLNELVPDAQFVKRSLKERWAIRSGADHSGGELRAVIRLNAFNHVRKLLHAMPDKHGGGIGIVVLEGLQVTEATVFINESVLVIEAAVLSCITYCIASQARFGDNLHVDLDPLTRVRHLFIRLWDILWIRQLYCHLPSVSQNTIQSGDGSAVAAFPELDPEHHQACVGISPAHVVDEFQLLRFVLVWMAVWTMGTVFQRLKRTIVTLHPAVNVLPVCPVPNRRCCYTILLRVTD